MIAGLFILCVVGAVGAAKQSCQGATKVPIDAVTNLAKGEPQWPMLFSSVPEEKCITFQYLAYSEGKDMEATAIYRNVKSNRWHSARKSVATADNKSWTCTHEKYPTVTYYASYFSQNGFCLYTCDVVNDVVETVRCFGKNANSKDELQKELSGTNKDFYDQKSAKYVYGEC